MSTPYINEELLQILQEFQDDTKTLFHERPASDFHFQPFKTGQAHGQWADKTGRTELQV
jgi:hypothetical protein